MVYQYRAIWSTTGGVGYSVFHARAVTTGPATAQAFADAVATLFNTITSTTLPSDVSISYDGEVVELDTSTGTLMAVEAVTPPSSTNFNGASVYAAPTGARIDWTTEAIVAGRRLRGRTYIVPMGAAAFANDGTLSSSTVTDLLAAADAYISAANVSTVLSPAVWSRPKYEGTGSERTITRPGTLADVVGRSIPDQAAVLRSRRD